MTEKPKLAPAPPPAIETPKVEAPDPFDLARLRVPTDYEHDAAVKKAPDDCPGPAPAPSRVDLGPPKRVLPRGAHGRGA